MKKAFLLPILMFGLGMQSDAAIINVSNAATSPINPPHTYNNLQTAIDAASDGDSLYIHGTNIDYGATTINNKTLILIGAGYGNNLQSNFQQKTYIQSITFSGFSGVKNVVLVGLFIQGAIATTGTGAPVNNLVIDRCALTTITSESNNLTIRQSLLEATDGTSIFRPIVTGNSLIQNSVLSGIISGGSVNSSLWENNIFKKAEYYYQRGHIETYNGTAIFINNIFNQGYNINVNNCTFNNNIFMAITPLSAGNGGTGNIYANPQFQNNGYLNSYSSIGKENYCTVVDYHLAAGSPGIGAGVGGTDIGIYGGTNALPATAALNGVPAMPRITEMNLQNVSVSPTGSLNVQIKAVKEN
jgi:hypothetical protein